MFLGCANQAGEDNRNVARMALLLAGLPAHVPGVTINRLCASGLDAVAAAARAIRAGEIDLAVAGGVESMTRAPFVMGKAERAFQRTAEIYDTTIGWRFVNARMKAHLRRRFDAGDRRERGCGFQCVARGPGCVRAAFAATRGARPGRRRVCRADRAGDHSPGQGSCRSSHRTRRTASPGDHARRACKTQTRGASRRHRHRRKRIDHQRWRRRAAPGIRSGRREVRA